MRRSEQRQRVEALVQHSEMFAKLHKLFPRVRVVADWGQDRIFTVTREHIQKAKPGNPARCALALSAKEQGYEGALIGRKFALLIKGNTAERLRVLTKTYLMILGLDVNKRLAAPGQYILSRITPSTRLTEMYRRISISRTKRATAQAKKAQQKPGKQPPHKAPSPPIQQPRGEVSYWRSWDRAAR